MAWSLFVFVVFTVFIVPKVMFQLKFLLCQNNKQFSLAVILNFFYRQMDFEQKILKFSISSIFVFSKNLVEEVHF